MIGEREFMQALEGAAVAFTEGKSSGDYSDQLGIEHSVLVQIAREAAEEAFKVLPGLPTEVPAEGDLHALRLSANQRRIVKAELFATYVSAFRAGVVAGRAS